MTSVRLEMPNELKDWAEQEAARRGLAGAGELVLDLLRRELERRDKIAAMQVLIDEALEDGVSDKSVEEILDEARRDAGLNRAPHGVQA